MSMICHQRLRKHAKLKYLFSDKNATAPVSFEISILSQNKFVVCPFHFD